MNDIKNHVGEILSSARYADGEATIPAYLLEQLADLAGVELEERCYTEV